MARFFRRRYLKARTRWSRENAVVRVTSTTGTFGTNIVPASNIQGVRTVGNITVTLTAAAGAAGCWWALVYVPQGQTAAALNVNDGQSLYEPNQYVLACGYNDVDAGPIRIHSKQMRKLHSGDFISLLMFDSAGAQGLVFVGTVSYSVKYN